MFQSDKGIEILTRSMATSYIGAPVEQYVNGATVLSATLIEPLSQVRFLMSSGVVLVYDYYQKEVLPNGQRSGMGQWSVYTNYSGVQAAVWDSAYTHARGNGYTCKDDANWSDNTGTTTGFVNLSVKTAWLSLAGIQGFQRVYKAMVLGDWKSPHTLYIGVAYDFDATIVQLEAIGSNSTVTPYQWHILLSRQKCEAVQFNISEVNEGFSGESLRLSGLALEVGGKQGLQKSPQTQTFG